MQFNMYMPVRVISGNNAVENNKSIFSQFGKTCLIITGKSSAVKSGALSDVISALNFYNIGYEVFDKVSANPLLSVCAQAGKVCTEIKADFIIAIGGGSALDAAKAAAIFATNTFPNEEDIFLKNFSSSPLPLIAIGTTAGTGSEVSAVTVLTLDSSGKKKSISDSQCYAKVALCDPKYTYNIPWDITVSTALDAFAHATEGWFSRKRNSVSCAFAEISLKPIWETLVTLSNGTELSHEERDNIFYGAIGAGMVLCVGTTYPHGLGYILTEDFGVPHGQACAVFDRHLIKWSKKYAPKDISEEFFRILGADSEEVDFVLSKLINIGNNVKMSDEDIAKVSERFGNDNPKYTNVYGNFNTQTAAELLKELFGE